MRDTVATSDFPGINESLYKKLSEKFGDLRDKKVVHADMIAGIHRVEVHNSKWSNRIQPQK